MQEKFFLKHCTSSLLMSLNGTRGVVSETVLKLLPCKVGNVLLIMRKLTFVLLAHIEWQSLRSLKGAWLEGYLLGNADLPNLKSKHGSENLCSLLKSVKLNFFLSNICRLLFIIYFISTLLSCLVRLKMHDTKRKGRWSV